MIGNGVEKFMTKLNKVDWHVLKGWSIEEELEHHGLSFEGLSYVENAIEGGSQKLRTKIIGGLGKDLRHELLEENDGDPEADLSRMKYGTYVISVGSEFTLDYSGGKKQSRVLYIGSGHVYNRIKSHLKGKLFDLVESLPMLRLRFHIADFGDAKKAKERCRILEQSLLQCFAERVDPTLPLLNKKNALNQKIDFSSLPKGWDKPLHKDRGRNQVEWKIEPVSAEIWKGSL